ncbi:unnamed protein product [Ambrosiozyma monospora]|uniref:Unnamed protein product n=1 Tax=Ambrosiozyma monospora TaxID=43982 RepID=A0A9W6Z773_AMBMO|nr:unnamed protein product [Ambrosiozyma monospora]
MQRLIRDIQINKSHYRGEVIGPVGMCVELQDQYHQWSWVIEILLQKALNTILVENRGDSTRLRKAIKNAKAYADITIRQREVFDFSNAVPRGYLTVADVLKFSNDNVLCHLVDANKIHNTVLIAKRAEAEQALYNDHENKIGSVICFVEKSALRISKKNGTLQTNPIRYTRQNRTRLRTTSELGNPLARIDTELAEMQRELQDLDQEKRQKVSDMRANIHDLKKKQKECRDNIRELQIGITKFSAKLEELESDSKIDSLTEERNQRIRDQKVQIQTVEALNNQMVIKKEEIEGAKAKYMKYLAEGKELKKLQRNQAMELGRNESNLRLTESSIRETEDKISQNDSDIEKLYQYINVTMPPLLEDLRVKASAICSLERANIQENDTKESVKQEIEKVVLHLRRLEDEIGISREQAEVDVHTARSRRDDVNDKVVKSRDLLKHLGAALDARVKNMELTAALMVLEVNYAFETALQIRKFKGRVKIDFDAGRLSLHVATKETEKLRNVESMSGGEKSYAQIAFLLAIWKPMHSKVRGLDEFDVFMDQVNRRLALKLILKKVRDNPKTQTIFITPLAITEIEGLDDKSVVIREIHPPERRSNA